MGVQSSAWTIFLLVLAQLPLQTLTAFTETGASFSLASFVVDCTLMFLSSAALSVQASFGSNCPDAKTICLHFTGPNDRQLPWVMPCSERQ